MEMMQDKDTRHVKKIKRGNNRTILAQQRKRERVGAFSLIVPLVRRIMNTFARPWICTRCASSLTRKTGHRTTSFARRRAYTTKPHPQDGRPFRMAVIGSGPAGFYTAYRVMSKIEHSVVDMYEQLPVPYGLVRFGVAPDHPEVKNCQDKFEEVASSPRFNFIGNVAVGGTTSSSVPLQVLLEHYNAVVFAYGASRDRTLGISGEDTLKGIHSARAFVGWYNGLPEYADLSPDLTQGEEAVVIGQGNVALDVARILLQDPDVLSKTDITSNAVETLRKSKVKRVSIVGRRGPLQAAYTIKEIRELIKLPSVAFHPVDESLMPEDISKLPRPTRRIMEILQKGSSASVSSAAKSWSLDFCRSPTSFNASASSPAQLGSLTFEKTSLSPNPFDPAAKALGTGELVEVPSSLAFRSIGYKSEALSDFTVSNIPFDDRLGVISNDQYGRVLSSGTAKVFPGLYCAGWVKRGPTGVIASTMQDAFSTADSIAEDWYSHVDFLESSGSGWDEVKKIAKTRGCRGVSWEDWQTIDAKERSSGESQGKKREKFTRVEDMLAMLD